MNPILQDLQNKQWVWTATNATQASPNMANSAANGMANGVLNGAPNTALGNGIQQNQSTGFEAFDKVLNNGFPRAGMIHVASPLGCGEIRLLLSILAMQSQQKQQVSMPEQKLYAFVNPPFELNAEFLLAHHIDLSQLVIIDAEKQASDALWSAEQCLKSGACEAVFVWQSHINHSHIRKLELAAQQGGAYCIWLEATGYLAIQEHSQTNNKQGLGIYKKAQNRQNLPLSLSLSITREDQSLNLTVNKQKTGWAQKAIKVPLPFKTRSNHAFKQRLQSHANVVSIHANSQHASR